MHLTADNSKVYVNLDTAIYVNHFFPTIVHHAKKHLYLCKKIQRKNDST